MFKKDSLKRWYIRVCRYLFNRKYLPVMAGPLKGYLWTTGSSYDYILGSYEDPQVAETFYSWLKPGTVFYDLGANVGFYALMANRVISTGKIYCFEPLPFLRSIFEQHIALNKKHIPHNNIEILPFAISDQEKEIRFSINSKWQDGNTYISSSEAYTGAEDTINVKCYSIDELLEQGFKAPDIMKIDVEGAELDVLKGAAETLKRYKPHIILATHDWHLRGVKDQCLLFLREQGYTVKKTNRHNKDITGLDDYIAIHNDNL